MHFRLTSDKSWLTVRRWLITLIAAVLLHVLALDWANDHVHVLRGDDEATPPPIAMVQLKPPPQPEPPAPAPKTKPAFKPKAKPKPQTAAPEPAMQATAADTPAEPPATDQVVTKTDGDLAPPAGQGTGDANKNNDQTQDKTVDKADEKTEEATAAAHYKVEFPPSVELKYDVEKVPADGGHPSWGSGTISWQKGGDHYQVVGEADVLFLTLLKFTSEGSFDSYGVAPVLYSEKRFRRSETATHFNRDDRRNISFSASTLSYPIKGGEQDFGSVFWELSGIARGDREKFVQGAQIDLFVAGTRDADIWSILVIGQEEIEIDHDKIQTWHVVRIPRTGSYDRKIDIWLAPQDQWYPVKIRQTEKSGEYVDMTMTSFHALPDQATR